MTATLLPKVIFVSDALCSWCWGMLPAVEEVRRQFAGTVEFDLMLGGLQIGSMRPLDAAGARRLIGVWERVRATTGQRFSMQVPRDPAFIFHSEVASRAINWARSQLQAPPWNFFHAVQEAFFLRAENINDPEVLLGVCRRVGLDGSTLAETLQDPVQIQSTRDGFDRAKRLGAFALPSVLMDLGDGPKLVSGGYLNEEFLRLELELRLLPPGDARH